MTADEYLRQFIFLEHLKEIHRLEFEEIMARLEELAQEDKTTLGFYMRHLRFIADVYCWSMKGILKMTDDPEVRSRAELALATDDFRKHDLDIGVETLLENKYKRGWEWVRGCLPWKRCERHEDGKHRWSGGTP